MRTIVGTGPPAQVAGHDRDVKDAQIVDRVGQTPLIDVSDLVEGDGFVRIYAKAEWFNPGGSVKDRAALNIIRSAIRSGELSREKTILDATSGNTGIAYALLGAALGYRVKLTMPANAGELFKQILAAYGAELVLTDPQQGSDGAIVEARRLHREAPRHYFYADQYNNSANWLAHYETTGPEIIEQTRGQVTHFVAGLGTSGTFTGVGRRLKEFARTIQIISVQPDSPLHGLEGLKHMQSAIVPGFYDPGLADANLAISTEEAQAFVKRLAREKGMLVGLSAGAAMAAALKVAAKIHSGLIVTIFPDGAHKYFNQRFWSESEWD
ncbi:MAG: PLP-dependent cysteine synthase family protein [bacterium]